MKRSPSPPMKRSKDNHYCSDFRSAMDNHRSLISRRLRQLFPRKRKSPAKMNINKPLPAVVTRKQSSPTSMAPYVLPSTPTNNSVNFVGHVVLRKMSMSPQRPRRTSSARSKSLRCVPQRGGSYKSLQQISQHSQQRPKSLKRDYSFVQSPAAAVAARSTPTPSIRETSSPLSISTASETDPKELERIPSHPILPSHAPKVELPVPTQPPKAQTPPPAPQATSPHSQENLADLAAYVNLHLLHTLIHSAAPSPQDDEQQQPQQPTNAARHIALRSFYLHILRRTHVTPTHILLALKYVQRLCAVAGGGLAAQPGTYEFPSDLPSGVKLTPRAILLVSLVLAGKYLDDVKRYANSAWAEVGGMTVADLNAAERECLAAMSFSLMVTPEEFDAWLRELDVLIRRANVATPIDASQGLEAFGKVA